MNEEIQGQFDRVETALNILIDSITSYNPSQSAAISLVEADDELSKGLERLSQHQANYTTILSLRATADALDTQIKSTLSLLADTRKELLTATPISAISTGTSTASSRQLDYAELLNYAQRIARFSVPSARQRRPAAPLVDGHQAIKQEVASPGPHVDQQSQQQQTTTPAQTPAPAPSTPGPAPATSSHLVQPNDSRAVESLPEEVRRWLDPSLANARFTPWPAEDVIRRGALGQIQGMLENGQDPEKSEINGIETQLATEEQQHGEADEQTENAGILQEGRKERKPDVSSMPPARNRHESRDDGILGFDLYNPDEE